MKQYLLIAALVFASNLALAEETAAPAAETATTATTEKAAPAAKAHDCSKIKNAKKKAACEAKHEKK